jgi:putative tryptophan/tyrosine transport system substrate-binding protein
MGKKVISLALGAMLFALCSSVGAQQPKKVPRIGYLLAGDPTSESARFEAIRLALRELGHIEGQNIATEYRYTEANPNRAPELAAELVRLKIGLTIPPEVLAQASRLIR